MSNIQVTHDRDLNNARSESSLVINPNNPQQIVAGSKKFINYHTYDFTLATSFSTDGGLHWNDSAPFALLPGWTGISDPAIAWDDSGNVFLVGLAFNNPPGSTIIGIAVYKSTDGGQTWSAPDLIHTSAGDDKQWAAGDGNPASPFHGRVYAAWDGPGGLCFARTLDHGITWIGIGNSRAGAPIATSSFSPEVNVAADGTVYIVFLNQEGGSEIKMVKSTDGGNSFQATPSPATGIGSFGIITIPGGNFRVITVPTACDSGSTIVVAWSDKREGNQRIYYAVSTNAGASWNTPASGQSLLKGLPIDSSVFQFHPQIVFRPDGVLGCAFYEFGNKPVVPKIDTRMALSFDNGVSFSQLFTVTDQPWDPTVDAPWAHGDPNLTFIGEYFGLDASGAGFYPLWTDTRTGIQELWTDKVLAQQVVLFEHANFHGAHKHVFGAEPNLNAADDNSFNDSVSSLAALNGSWSFFRDAGYMGQYQGVLAPGLYPWVEAVNITNDDMSSLRSTNSSGLAAVPHAILFEHANFHGAHKHVFGPESNLNAGDDNFFNDRASSIIVLAGTWEFFRDAGFHGSYGVVLGPGLYPWVEAVKIKNDDMSSLQPTDSSGLATGPHVILFEHANFYGAHKHVFGPESNLNAGDDDFFNDRVSSIVVLAGTWQFFRDAGFHGAYPTVLGPGLYPWVEAVGIKNDDMSSLQPA